VIRSGERAKVAEETWLTYLNGLSSLFHDFFFVPKFLITSYFSFLNITLTVFITDPPSNASKISEGADAIEEFEAILGPLLDGKMSDFSKMQV
jgi:hypothetical protein